MNHFIQLQHKAWIKNLCSNICIILFYPIYVFMILFMANIVYICLSLGQSSRFVTSTLNSFLFYIVKMRCWTKLEMLWVLSYFLTSNS